MTKTEKRVQEMIDLVCSIRDAFGAFHLDNLAKYIEKNFVTLDEHNDVLVANGKMNEELKLLRSENQKLKSQMKKLAGGE